jgi:hypothetical protein
VKKFLCEAILIALGSRCQQRFKEPTSWFFWIDREGLSAFAPVRNTYLNYPLDTQRPRRGKEDSFVKWFLGWARVQGSSAAAGLVFPVVWAILW